MDPFLGEIRINAFDFAPHGYATCDGQLLNISQNQALFSLLNFRFGGNGSTIFALPDMRGRVPIQKGRGAGLSPYAVGNAGGAENVALTISEMPTHTHTAQAVSGAQADGKGPLNNFYGQTNPSLNIYAQPGTQVTALHPATVSTAGSSQGHNNMQPFLVLNFCIALTGIYPPRN